MLKILLIEDHALVREGMLHLLKQLNHEVVILEAPDGEVGVTALEQHADIDLVLLDLALPGVDGLSWLKLQRKRFPDVPVVVVSAYDDAVTVDKVMRAGASGFIAKTSPADRLLGDVLRVLDGDLVRPSGQLSVPEGIDFPDGVETSEAAVAPGVARTRTKDLGLSARQTEVLGLIVKGKTNREIAHLLGLTEGTVKIHVTAVFKALGVKSRTQALVSAKRHNIRGL